MIIEYLFGIFAILGLWITRDLYECSRDQATVLKLFLELGVQRGFISFGPGQHRMRMCFSHLAKVISAEYFGDPVDIHVVQLMQLKSTS